MKGYEVKNIEDIDSPALLIYEDRLRANIKEALRIAGGPERLRPHVKTHKMAEVVILHLELGVRKFKCATIAEAEMLALAGASDVLIAHQPTGPKIHRIVALIRHFPSVVFSTIVDNEDTAKEISAVCEKAGVVIPLFLDIDTGMHRTGIAPGETAIKLYRLLDTLPGVSPGGIHAYDGHIRDRDFSVRKEKSDKAFQPVSQMIETIEGEGGNVPAIIAGGSPTFPVHAQRPDVQLSPGTYVFWDAGYAEMLPDMNFVPAALVFTRVVSKPGEGLICLDLGHKALASENPHPRVKLLDIEVSAFTGHSEEHLVVHTPDAERLKPGDGLYGIPLHICPTVALYQEAEIVNNGRAQGRWKVVARDRKIGV
ncbi:MAG: D-TA family PLP-dependent enzyme [Bacteroidia bacterium]|nr:D-TA family PLP-dependent enzyme [Bacteroidia bacterium]